ncbi:aspartate aminotransferase family protein [Amorphus orientalis]|uniref:Adenosylmethionine-8-amino-7-oxononanoate aminotransferase n=1 Tax=Amorphus orientalis TaxID=649198 RepID=A0AAE4AVN4_9HYPH|nr:aspartate aminotransferase family protein [Amorphus orientalis]MDQ0316844.1 adenosylmethionine-8-amino-7-oxononanoate aminotransferase [Amorphus orientalis]
MTHVLHRKLGKTPPTVVHAEGLWLRDSEGRTYLDAVSGGAAVSAIGHGDPRVQAAIDAQLARVDFAHNSFFTNEPAEALADHLAERAPGGLSRVLYCSGGSEAMEAALKLARQIWIERGRPEKRTIIAREQSYHGGTLGALSIGGNKPRSMPFRPMLFDTRFIEPCYAYRYRHDGESEADYGARAAAALERMIQKEEADTVAAFVCEPVVGATLGCAPAAAGYLKRIREICDHHDILLIFDEVMCGAGRTGYTFACEEDAATPDILAMAKGLGGGYQPIGALLVHDRLVDTIVSGSGALLQGFTYMAHPVACAAALRVQQIMVEDGLLERVRDKGELLRRRLEATFGQHPHVGDIRGRGLFLGMELVEDRSTKAPFDPRLGIAARLKAVAMDEGLMVYPSGGTVDGTNGDHVLLAPAYTVSDEEIDEIVVRLSRSLNRTLAEAVRP